MDQKENPLSPQNQLNINQHLIKINSQRKSNCQIHHTFPLERFGIEKTRVETGAATKVRSNDPTKRPGRFPSPNEIAPSSRNGSTTKYALKICKLKKLVMHSSTT